LWSTKNKYLVTQKRAMHAKFSHFTPQGLQTWHQAVFLKEGLARPECAVKQLLWRIWESVSWLEWSEGETQSEKLNEREDKRKTRLDREGWYWDEN
jgi:hypothetical protein